MAGSFISNDVENEMIELSMVNAIINRLIIAEELMNLNNKEYMDVFCRNRYWIYNNKSCHN